MSYLCEDQARRLQWQTHDVEPWGPFVQLQLCIILVKCLHVIDGLYELQDVHVQVYVRAYE